MENMIAIIGAMDEEVTSLTQALANTHEEQNRFSDLPIFTGQLRGKNVVIARCGIGKVNAALATQFLLDNYHPKVIINTGVAGGVSPMVKIGDLVIGHSSLQHDFDVQNFGYPRGVIPRLKTSLFQAEQRLVELAADAATEIFGANRIHKGFIVSGDQFVSSIEQKEAILRFFSEATCVEMEGAAIAQVAYMNQVSHLIVRAISDQADTTAPGDFDQYLSEIIPSLNGVIMKLVELIEI